ncbi:MAG: hypothetical protein ACFB22_06615 [Rhodothalassiaceae bacterium]
MFGLRLPAAEALARRRNSYLTPAAAYCPCLMLPNLFSGRVCTAKGWFDVCGIALQARRSF